MIQQSDRYRAPALLRGFGARIGPACHLKPGLRVKFPWRLQLGAACWLAEDVWLDNLAPISLGDRVCLSQGAIVHGNPAVLVGHR